MNTFQRSVYFAHENSEVVYENMDNPTYRENCSILNIRWNSNLYRLVLGGATFYSYIDIMRRYDMTAAEIFEATRISQSRWNEMINW